MTTTNRVGFALLVSAMVACFSTGCGSEACADATEKLEEECGKDVGEPVPESECTGRAECTALCVLDVCTCEDAEGPVGQASEPCMECILNCADE